MLVRPALSAVEQPNYHVLSADQNIDIRRYEPMIIAEVVTYGDRETSIRDGFRLLADYIFGNNTVRETIPMTAPVQQEKSKKIAMTAPVQQEPIDDAFDAWNVHFIMPSEFTMKTLPKPNDDRVLLKQIPSKTYAVITFSGVASKKTITSHKTQLLNYIKTNNIQTIGSPRYAFYNPPWTLPFLRRNEVMIEIVYF